VLEGGDIVCFGETSKALNEGWAYEEEGRYRNTGETGITGIISFNGRVIRLSNVNIELELELIQTHMTQKPMLRVETLEPLMSFISP
jgi:hypothetical protein